MKLTIERQVTQEIKGILQNAAAMNTLDGAQKYLAGLLPNWYVYRGGSHIALHLETNKTNKGKRYAIITE